MKRRSPFATRGQLPAGSTANAEAKASAKSQASAGASTGVRVHPSRRTPQTSSVSAAQSTSEMEMGAIDHGSAAASRRKETVEARVRASDNLEGLAVRRHRQLRRAVPRERARPRDPLPDEPLAPQAVPQEIDDRLRPDLGFAGREEHRRVSEGFLERARRGGEHRRAAGHRLERRKPEALIQ